MMTDINMSFEEVKELISLAHMNPTHFFNNVHKFVPNWSIEIAVMLSAIEKSLEEKEVPEEERPDTMTLIHGYLMLPAILLEEDDELSHKIYTALVLAIQNYSVIFENEQCMGIVDPLVKLISLEQTLDNLITKAESLILQMQAYSTNVNIPYKLSQKFLTTLLRNDEEEK